MPQYYNLITPCIKYLSDKNLTDDEYKKLFVLHKAVFGMTALQEDSFISCCHSEKLCPKQYSTDEINEMQKKLIEPQGKRVHPIGCFDITRINAFGAINVPKAVCTECIYSKTYSNMHKDKEDILLAYILHTGNIPSEIRIALSDKSTKRYDEIMRSSLVLQYDSTDGPAAVSVKFNAFILRYLIANSALLNFENIEDTLRSIRIKTDTVLIKELKLQVPADKIKESLYKELLYISCIDTREKQDRKRADNSNIQPPHTLAPAVSSESNSNNASKGYRDTAKAQRIHYEAPVSYYPEKYAIDDTLKSCINIVGNPNFFQPTA